MKPINLHSKPTYHRWLAPICIIFAAIALLLLPLILQ
jgi:hypothetical protein